jgi:hypothetical protein
MSAKPTAQGKPCCQPYLVQVSVRRCEPLGTRWSSGTEQCRAALLIMPDQHPTFRELVLANAPLLGLLPAEHAQWQHERGLQLDGAYLSLETRLYPVFADRTLTLQLYKS